MTNQHPITPPPELVEEWHSNSPLDRGLTLATQAAQWGADQQLAACCEWLRGEYDWGLAAALRLDAELRPDPPSLKEQALALLDKAEDPSWDINDFSIVRKALEQLND